MAHTNSSFYFQSGGVRLRAMQNADWQHMYEEEDDSEGIRVFEAGVQYPRSPEQLQARVIQAVERSTKGESAGNWFFVVETLSGQAVGVGNFHGYDPRSGTSALPSVSTGLFGAMGTRARRCASSFATGSKNCAARKPIRQRFPATWPPSGCTNRWVFGSRDAYAAMYSPATNIKTRSCLG